MAPDFDSSVDVVKHCVVGMTTRFSVADLNENTVLNTVDVDDDQHLTELKLATFKAVQDGDQATWNFKQFMALQTYAVSSTISTAAQDIVDAAAIARTPNP